MSQVPAIKLKVEYWPLDKIKPFERNPRIHGEEQIKTLVEAIGLFGFVVPLLVDEDGELIAGHGRLLAAKRAAMTEVPVIRVKHFTEAQRRAYVIADNRIANMAKWDERLMERYGGQVPVVTVDIDPVHRMMSTIRHNRARGHHGIVPMASIVQTIVGDGVSKDDVQRRLGMEDEEVDRLLDRAGMPTNTGTGFGKSWVPGGE